MGLKTQEIIRQQLDQARRDASRRLEEAYQPKETDSPGMYHESYRPSWMGQRPAPLLQAEKACTRIPLIGRLLRVLISS